MGEMRPTIEFDQHSVEYVAAWEQGVRERLERTPVAWTEAHGGHWVVSKYEDALRVLTDYETFSSEHGNPARPQSKGVLMPPGAYPLPLTESDPPIHTKRRMTEAPFFAPRAIREWEQVVKVHVQEALDAVIESGRIDFVPDLAVPVPAMTTMQVVGVDLAHWKEFALSAHEGSFRPRTDPLYPHEATKSVQGKMLDLLHERRADPREDIASAIANRVIDGEPLGDEVGVGMMSALIFGGFDTTTSAILNALLWLEGKADVQARLLEDDVLIQNAVEELLRLWPPTHHMGRNVIRDVELRGQQMRAGERVMASLVAANRDPDKFDAPEEIRLDRLNAKEHLSFSGGVHKCLGAPLARMEIRIILRAVLARIPDYRIDRSGVVRYPTLGGVAGYQHVPATFSPGRRIHDAA